MNSKREAKKILKAYGKAVYKERVKYVDSFSEEKIPAIRKISYRRMVKRSMIAVLVLILTFSLLVVGANALGIKLLNLSIFETNTHSEITGNQEGKAAAEEEVKFYRPNYVPEGYSLINEEMGDEVSASYIYKNQSDEYLYIYESIEDDFSAQIDNEDCEISTETVLDMEVRVYRYEKAGTYLMKKGKIYILISGSVKDKEMKEIIRNFK